MVLNYTDIDKSAVIRSEKEVSLKRVSVALIGAFIKSAHFISVLYHLSQTGVKCQPVLIFIQDLGAN